MSTSTPAGTGRPVLEEPSSQDRDRDRDRGAQEQGPRSGRSARRTFTTEFKRAVVQEYDAALNGSKGAVLRRERLYDSHIQEMAGRVGCGQG